MWPFNTGFTVGWRCQSQLLSSVGLLFVPNRSKKGFTTKCLLDPPPCESVLTILTKTIEVKVTTLTRTGSDAAAVYLQVVTLYNVNVIVNMT